MKNPVKFENKHDTASAAVVFVHGFTGDGVGTWGTFPKILEADPRLGRFDFYFWQYPSSLNPKYALTKWFWENDPDIPTLGQGLGALLDNTIASAEPEYQEIKLVAHSMGGLVVQAYVVDQLHRIRTRQLAAEESVLGRINEIVLFASPSGGLGKARIGGFLKKQISNMSDTGSFIRNLRQQWVEQVEDHRHEEAPLAAFRLTTVAGMKDRFVPPESALDPFPHDEQFYIPGNHVELVKPNEVGQQPVDILVKRLLRETPTPDELRVIYGHSQDAVDRMRAVQAAAELADVDTLIANADELLQDDVVLPKVEKALGLALGRQSQHERAVALLQRYLNFELDGDTPFAGDVQAIQQLAVAESGLGNHTKAVATLKSLPAEYQVDPETLGITAGRLKRRWLESGPPRLPALGRSALDTYRAGYEAAVASDDVDQVLYNGINTAFMSLAMNRPYDELAKIVLAATDTAGDDYWVAATRAEALLLLGRYEEAETAYNNAFEFSTDSRYLATTGLQAANIIELQNAPAAAHGIRELFDSMLGSPETMHGFEDTVEEQKDIEEIPDLATTERRPSNA